MDHDFIQLEGLILILSIEINSNEIILINNFGINPVRPLELLLLLLSISFGRR